MGTGIDHPAPADIEDRGQRRHAGGVVHDDPTGKIQHAPALQEPTAPDHMHEGEIDEEEPQRQEGHIGFEGHPVGESAGDERRGDDREHHLIGDMHEERDARRGRGRCQGHAMQEGHVQIADDPADIAGEAERIADREPDHRGPAHGDEGLHHDGEHVLAADQPAVEEGQPGRHQHHQAAAQDHETGIAGIEIGHGFPQGCGASDAPLLP